MRSIIRIAVRLSQARHVDAERHRELCRRLLERTGDGYPSRRSQLIWERNTLTKRS
jgi:hypothetical protein